MDAKIKTDWLEALRHGGHKQGRGFLKSDGAYCCLGVLCKVMGLKDEYLEDKQFGFLPTDDLNEKSQLPALEQNKLANLNDQGWTFLAIADYIEAHY